MTDYVSEFFNAGPEGADLSTSNTSADLISASKPTFSSDAKEGAFSMAVDTETSLAKSARFPFGALLSHVFIGQWIKSAGAWPSGQVYPCTIRAGSTVKTDWRVSNGIIVMRGDGSGQTLQWTGTALPQDIWLFIEHELIVGTAKQQLKVYSEAGAVLIDSGVQNWAAAANVDTVIVGNNTASTGVHTRTDSVKVSDVSNAPTPPSNTAPTCSAGPDQTNIEPYSEITLTGTDSDSDGTIAGRIWTQTAGPATTIINDNQQVATVEAPGTIAGTSMTYKYTVTDNDGATAEDTVDITVLPVTERAVRGGVEVPVRLLAVKS